MCLWPDVKMGLICNKGTSLQILQGRSLCGSRAYTRHPELETGKASKNLRTVWLQVGWAEGSSMCDKAEAARVPLGSALSIPVASHTPNKLDRNFWGVGCWNALSSLGNLNRQPGTGNPGLR